MADKYKQMYWDFFETPFNKMGNMADELTDLNSPFYKSFGSFLNKSTPQIGTDTFLGMMMAGGGGYGTSQNLATKKAKAFDMQRREGINQAVQGFALGNIGNAANLRGQQGQLGMSFINLMEQKRQFDEQQKFNVGDFIGGVITTGAGAFLGNPGAFTSMFGGKKNTFQPNNITMGNNYSWGGPRNMGNMSGNLGGGSQWP